MATGPRISIDCPHCNSKAAVRSSRTVEPTYKHLNYQCSNLECGHTFAAALQILYTISPSAMPNPAVSLRTAPPRRPANENHPLAANDITGGPEVPLPVANDNLEAG